MDTTHSKLTSTEMGKLWATYVGNTMGECVLRYYLNHVEDKNVKSILTYALGLCEEYIQDIKTIFVRENFPIPIGFTDNDVNVEAPRLYDDDFYLYYLQYLGKAGMSLYSVAIPLVTRRDIRNFYVKALRGTVKLMADVNDVLQAKGILMNSPAIPNPNQVDFVTKQNFLHGFVGDIRPLHGLEIAHLFGNLNNDITSKALIIGFEQTAQGDKARKYLERGKQLNTKHIDRMTKKLTEEYLPSPTLIDHLVTPSIIPPFSDKLMVFHKIDMFSMKVREYAGGASVNGRRDIGALYARCILDVSLYVEDGANIMIEQGWMEQPPEAVDRDHLVKT